MNKIKKNYKKIKPKIKKNISILVFNLIVILFIK